MQAERRARFGALLKQFRLDAGDDAAKPMGQIGRRLPAQAYGLLSLAVPPEAYPKCARRVLRMERSRYSSIVRLR